MAPSTESAATEKHHIRQGVISLPAPEWNQYAAHSCYITVKVSI